MDVQGVTLLRTATTGAGMIPLPTPSRLLLQPIVLTSLGEVGAFCQGTAAPIPATSPPVGQGPVHAALVAAGVPAPALLVAVGLPLESILV